MGEGEVSLASPTKEPLMTRRRYSMPGEPGAEKPAKPPNPRQRRRPVQPGNFLGATRMREVFDPAELSCTLFPEDDSTDGVATRRELRKVVIYDQYGWLTVAYLARTLHIEPHLSDLGTHYEKPSMVLMRYRKKKGTYCYHHAFAVNQDAILAFKPIFDRWVEEIKAGVFAGDGMTEDQWRLAGDADHCDTMIMRRRRQVAK